ncbi:MAG: hypothetical protein BWY75_00634 [bacterium ADurb.Bin425]|nr:MAG: hypothetical protein BWY75_00634 [bacterium ADurb.Bin425]
MGFIQFHLPQMGKRKIIDIHRRQATSSQSLVFTDSLDQFSVNKLRLGKLTRAQLDDSQVGNG